MTLSAMTFCEAVEAMKRGEKVRREGWGSRGSCLFMVHGEIIAAGGSIALPWLAPASDTEANDWVVVN